MDLNSRTDEQVRLLADPRNRTLLTVLGDSGSPLHVEELASRLVSRNVSVVSSAEYEDQLEETLLTLHHERLPRLADSGLIEYDPETNVVTYQATTAINGEWETETLIDALATHLPTSPVADEDTIGVLHGRNTIIEQGRQLADEAEEELFCMYVSTELLEDDCIHHAEDAIDRGVSLYVGSQNADVRDLTRKYLPEATIWEPQLDWLNSPTYPRIGRLVLVDRCRVMLAILEEPDSDGTHPEETAFIGTGEESPLVVLVRELLGSRIDHLDYQSTDFRTELST